MLLKGLGEVQSAPQPLQAAEMVLIRLTYAADLPPPADLVRQLQEGGGNGAAAPAAAVRRGGSSSDRRCRRLRPSRRRCCAASRGDSGDRPRALAQGGGGMMAAPGVARRRPRQRCRPIRKSYEDVVDAAAGAARGHPLRPAPQQCASRALRAGPARDPAGAAGARQSRQPAGRAARRMDRPPLGGRRVVASRATRRWRSRSPPPKPSERAEIEAHPLVQAAMKAFPGATIETVRTPVSSLPSAWA